MRKVTSLSSVFSFNRLTIVALSFFVLGGLLLFRLFQLQIIDRNFYADRAAQLHERTTAIDPERGEILMDDRGARTTFPLATNRTMYYVYAVPKDIRDYVRTARLLAPILGMVEGEIVKRVNKPDDPYEPLAHEILEENMKKAEALNLSGIRFEKELVRYYPNGVVGGHLVGFVGKGDAEKKGQYGLEQYFDEILRGRKGKMDVERDPKGRWIATGKREEQDAVNGATIVLTIDRTVEFFVCDKLKKAVERHTADGGTAIVVDPKTGAILALCNVPDFDPNTYGEIKDPSTFINSAIFSPYEPGSIFKTITMAGGIDQHVVTPEMTYIDEGFVKIGKYTIRNSDYKRHGQQTMVQVLDESLNTGAIFVAEKLGIDFFRDYVLRFGFGEKTGIELPGEAKGDIATTLKKGQIYLATASFGQGITVTPLQMAMAYAAIANKGILMKPYLVREIRYGDGRVEKYEPKAIRSVMAEKTATVASAMLASVVEHGHGKRAKVPGYYVGGKTGTAQVPRKDGRGYESNITIGSFAGFLPIDDPRFTIFVKIDHPRDVQWAESSAAPLFGEIADFLVHYYRVPPDVSAR